MKQLSNVTKGKVKTGKICFQLKRFAILISMASFLVCNAMFKAHAQNSRAYITNFGDSTISVIDVDNLSKITDIVTGKNPHGVDVSRNGKWIAVSNEGDNTVTIIEAASNKIITKVHVGSHPHQLAFSIDSKMLFVTENADDALGIINSSSWKLDTTINVGRNPHIVLPGHNGKLAYITLEGDEKLVVLDLTTLKITGEIPVFGWPRIPSLSPDDKTIYLSMRWLNGALIIPTEFKKATNWLQLPETNVFPVDGKASHGIKVSANGKHLFITSQVRNSLSIINTETNKPEKEIVVGSDPNWIDLTGDEKFGVVSNTGSNNVSIIDLQKYEVIKTIQVGNAPKRLKVAKFQ